MERVRERRLELAPHDSATRFTSLGVDVFFGDASFADDRTVVVAQNSSSARLRFRRAVVTTGSRPSMPDIPGLAARVPLTSDTLFELTGQPATLLIIGAGAVGCEMAQAFALLGTDVTLADTASRVLPKEDADASAIVARSLERCGVRLALGAPPVIGDGPLLVATGRTPNIDGLNLAAAGIDADGSGVIVDDRLRTSNHRVFAAGDVCSPYRFTHAADAMARIVIQNALFHGRKRVSDLVIPWCTYTFPEVAHVGAATDAGTVITVPLADVDRAVTDDQAEGFVRIRHERGQVVGATIVAPQAGELIGHVAQLMDNDGTLGDLSTTVFPYPTVGEALRKAGDQYRRGSLTPMLQGMLRRYFAVTRR
jgi:pyruvate/2-oxoglutarate dehydrogenase complex dihydrolipoamide dehydrogenase (E3) component